MAGADIQALTTHVEKHSQDVPKALSTSDKKPAVAPPPALEHAQKVGTKEELNEHVRGVTNGDKVVPSSKTPSAPEPAQPGNKVETEEELNERMRGIMNSDKVVLFMKGSPDAPRCGFSRQTVEILRKHDVKFTHFDILQDEAVRQGESGCSAVKTDPKVLTGLGIGRVEEA